MNLRVCILLLAANAVFAACSSVNSTPPLGRTDAVRDVGAASTSGRTTAWGHLVNDPSGRPLADILVRLEPWDRGCVKTSRHTASCPGYLRWRTTTQRDGKFTLRSVPNGDYLLVIGSDSPADLTRPTIHDHVKLTGGSQQLLAPTLPTIPCSMAQYKEWCDSVAPSPNVTAFPRPAVEKHGQYRLATIEPKREQPCVVEFNKQRAKRRLPLVVVDEWLAENTREVMAYRFAYRPPTDIPQPYPYLTINETAAAGGNDCTEMIDAYFPTDTMTGKVLRDPRTRWVGAIWYRYSPVGDQGGEAQFPIDVRLHLDHLQGPWP
jgi:hypothetical protein